MFQVLDENDNNPQFVSIPSNWSVRENSPIGKKMMTWIVGFQMNTSSASLFKNQLLESKMRQFIISSVLENFLNF